VTDPAISKETAPPAGVSAKPPEASGSRTERRTVIALILSLAFCAAGPVLWLAAPFLPTRTAITVVLGLSGVVAALGLVAAVIVREMTDEDSKIRGVRAATRFAVLFPIAFLLFAFIVLPALEGRRSETRRIVSVGHLSRIGRAATEWMLKRGGGQKLYPPSLKTLLDDRFVKDPTFFIYPERLPDGRDVTQSKLRKGEFVTDYESLFDRAGFRVASAAAPSDLAMAWEKDGVCTYGRNVLFLDGHTEHVVGDEAFLALVKRVDQWIEEHKPK